MAKKDKVIASISMRNFPRELHTAAKIQAAKEQTTLREIVIKALTEYLERSGSWKETRKG